MRKILLLIFSVLILISLDGCEQTSSTGNKGFSEDEAISMVIKDHPEFPSNKDDTINIRSFPNWNAAFEKRSKTSLCDFFSWGMVKYQTYYHTL